jgi:hypothetical protein
VNRPRALRDLYEGFNVQFWDGRLPHAQRVLTVGGDPFMRGISLRRVGVGPFGSHGLRCKGARGFVTGLFRPPGAHWPAEIRILSSLGDRERRVLLHEMSHAAAWFGGFPDEKHGPRFVAELERLATLGETWAAEDAARYRAEAARAERKAGESARIGTE